MFIAFEGLDGSGSSTQAQLLAERLRSAGRTVILTKEPTDSNPIGRLVRQALQHQWQPSAEALQLLFSADRAEHLKEVILPALARGEVVITDRYLLSTLAFGGLEIEMEWLSELNKKFIQPDLTFLLELSAEECMQRILKRGQELELFEKKEQLERVWVNYQKASKTVSNLHFIDANPSIESVAEVIWNITQTKL